MKRYFNIVAVLLIALAFTSCDESIRRAKQDRSTGATSEIMVVVQNEDQWTGRIGDSLRSFFLDYQYGLPQPESRNELKHIKAAGFTDLFKKHKAIIEVDIDPSLEKAVAETAEDMWASPQRYIKISAPNITSWVELFDKQKEVYQQWFNKVEHQRILNVFHGTIDQGVSDTIAKRFGFSMIVPQGFYIAVDKPDFMWLRKELERSSADIVLYQVPYKDTLQFEPQSLVAMRNMMMQQNIPGPTEGSYMSTEMEFVLPLVTTVNDFPAGYAKEMRGMWKMENDFMGGPFVSYTFADDHTGNLVTAEGFYYEPNQKKRNMLLQLESILYSLKYVE